MQEQVRAQSQDHAIDVVLDFWRLPGPTLRAGAGNASKRPSGGLLGPLCGLGPEMLQSGLLEASWPHFAGCLQAWGLDFYRNLGCILSLGARFLSQFASYPKPGGSFSIAICVVS